ncbi:MAG: hypothetical protein ACREV2_18815, partial [Burkholderiales bacterium]
MAARVYIQRNLQGKVFRNRDTGWDISIGKKGRNKTTSGPRSTEHFKSVVALPD